MERQARWNVRAAPVVTPLAPVERPVNRVPLTAVLAHRPAGTMIAGLRKTAPTAQRIVDLAQPLAEMVFVGCSRTARIAHRTVVHALPLAAMTVVERGKHVPIARTTVGVVFPDVEMVRVASLKTARTVLRIAGVASHPVGTEHAHPMKIA